MDTRKALAWFWLIAIDLNMLSGYSYVVSGESFLDLPRLVSCSTAGLRNYNGRAPLNQKRFQGRLVFRHR